MVVSLAFLYASSLLNQSEPPKLVILPPTVRTQQNAQRNDDQLNPNELMSRVIPRMQEEAKKKKWPFSILASSDAEAAYVGAAQAQRDPSKEYAFGYLKPMAEKLGVRYLAAFAINELTGYRSTNTMQAMSKARTQIDLVVYDHDTDSYVWQDSEKAESGRASFFNRGSIAQRMDQAMVNALVRSLEPFAKGERKSIERPVSNIIATVQRVLGDGKRVLLDVGRAQNVVIGDILKSVESDCEIKVTEVLDNGSIAEITAGSAKEKEVFKPKRS